MSGTYSCNNNQNYFIQDNRSTSRVLQPPGGASSISFGGNSGSAPPVHRQTGTPDSSKSETSTMPRRRSDSLDNNCSIPGLESHYRGQRESASHDRDESKRLAVSRDSSPMTDKQLYASQLKQQIDDQKAHQSTSPRVRQMRSGSPSGGAESSPEKTDPRYDKAMQIYRNTSEKQQSGHSSQVGTNLRNKNVADPRSSGGPQRNSSDPNSMSQAGTAPQRRQGQGQNQGQGIAMGSNHGGKSNKPAQAPARPSVSVAMPPGGRSSLSLGWG